MAPSTRPTFPADSRFEAQDISFVTSREGWVTGGGRVLRTKDGGATWTELPRPPLAFTHLVFTTSTVGYGWEIQGPLWLTRDGGRTWVDGGLRVVDDVRTGTGTAWALTGDGPGLELYRATVGSTRWTDLGLAPNRYSTLDVLRDTAYLMGQQGAGPIAPALGIVTRFGKAMRILNVPSDPGGVVFPDSPLGVSRDGTLFLVLSMLDSDGRSHQLAYASSDGGATWGHTTAPPIDPADVLAIPGARFAWNQDLYISRDCHRWTLALKGPGGGQFFKRVAFVDDQHGYALALDGSLHLTRDGGRTWTDSRSAEIK